MGIKRTRHFLLERSITPSTVARWLGFEPRGWETVKEYDRRVQARRDLMVVQEMESSIPGFITAGVRYRVRQRDTLASSKLDVAPPSR